MPKGVYDRRLRGQSHRDFLIRHLQAQEYPIYHSDLYNHMARRMDGRTFGNLLRQLLDEGLILQSQRNGGTLYQWRR